MSRTVTFLCYTLIVAFYVSLALTAFGCGSIDTGYVDRKVDCVDGCQSTYTSDGDPHEPRVESGTQPKDGKDGTNGKDGQPGKDGVQGPTGSPGTTGVDGANGDPGAVGPTGSDGLSGPPGSDGYSIVFESFAAITCPTGGTTFLFAIDTDRSADWGPFDANQRSATVCNGLNGEDGEDAPPTQFTPVEIVDPCGDSPGVLDEVFLRLADGTLLASVSDNSSGQNTRFGILVPGSWTTTDGSVCHFTVTAQGEVEWP